MDKRSIYAALESKHGKDHAEIMWKRMMAAADNGKK